MAKKLGFGTDGVRGRAYSELSLELAAKIGWACAQTFNIETVVIGGDTRESTPQLSAAVISGVIQASPEITTVVDLEVIPTPAIATVAAELNAVGFMISASHNPWHDNGIKVFGPGGTKLTSSQQDTIETLIEKAPTLKTELSGSDPETNTYRKASIDDIEALSSIWTKLPLQSVKDIATAAPEPAAASATPGAPAAPGPAAEPEAAAEPAASSSAIMKVVVDCANGAASKWAKKIFAQLDIETEIIAAEPDGRNINENCGSTQLGPLAEYVKTTGADLGLALDGDADRLLAVDEKGETVDGDKLLALFAQDLKNRGKLAANTLVVTVMSNLGLHKAMAQNGIDVHVTKVGDRSVSAGMQSTGAVIGGEQSGHIIFSRYSSTGDGIFSGVRLVDLVARSHKPLSQLASEAMQTFPQILKNVVVESDRTALMEALTLAISEAEKQLGTNGRVLVRPSGTEPLVRVMVEASSQDQAETISQQLVEAVNQLK